MFSQVRDCTQEINAINKLKRNDLECLYVTSGGCTVMSLLSDKIKRIDCVDINDSQNKLVKLKIGLCLLYDSVDDILNFYEGRLSDTEYIEIMKILLQKKYISLEDYNFWMKTENFNSILNGINQSGKYEIIFKDLVISGFDFEKIFSRNNLIQNFGQNAVNNSMKKEFCVHFKNILETYKMRYSDPNENYFYFQILNNMYPKRSEFNLRYNLSLPKYLKLLKLRNTVDYQKLNFITQNYVMYLKDCNDEKYDVIHTSNLSDWMKSDELDDFIKNIYRSLKKGGIVIMRKLNGDYELEKIMKKYFNKTEKFLDESYFYDENIFGFK